MTATQRAVPTEVVLPNGRRRGRGTLEQAAATRAALVELAAELFAESGYLQTSIRDLTRKGNVTAGAVYGHFRNKADLLAAAVNREMDAGLGTVARDDSDYIEVATRVARTWRKRRRLRALVLQGAAAAPTDAPTREQLREAQLAQLDRWVRDYEPQRDRLGIDAHVDIRTAVMFQWAAEIGLGALEAIGIEPRSSAAWADVANRYMRSWQLPPDRTRTK